MKCVIFKMVLILNILKLTRFKINHNHKGSDYILESSLALQYHKLM
jgi:hypothetical protein